MNYEKMSNAENSRRILKFSLLAFLTFEIILHVLVYGIVMVAQLGTEERTIRDIYYVGATMISLIFLVASFYSKPAAILQYFTVYRILHILIIFGLLYLDEVPVYPFTVIVVFGIQFFYLTKAIFTKQMHFPGKIICDLLKNTKNIGENKQRSENPKKYFTSIASEVVRSECTHPDEIEDNLFDYETASENELYSANMFNSGDYTILY